MAAVSFFPAILLLITTATAMLPPPPPIPPPPFTHRRPHPRPPQRERGRGGPFMFQDNSNHNRLINIIDALMGSGDFAGWINLLSTTDPSSIPLTATLFIPSNDAVSHFPSAGISGAVPFDPLLLPYHIVPQRLTFADLRRLPTHTRLPTLLSSKYVIITNNSASNFAVDDSKITMPDIFENNAFSVHGVDKVLDYSIYGNGDGHLPPAAEKAAPPPSLTRPRDILPQPSNIISSEVPGEAVAGAGMSSGTSSFVCSQSLMGIFILSNLFALPIG